MSVRETLSELYYSLFYDFGAKSHSYKYMRHIGIAIGGLVVASGLFLGHRWYAVNREQKAQEVFAGCVAEFERAERDANLWPNAELVFHLGYEHHAGSNLGPYFKVFEAEAQVHQGKQSEARVTMEQAVSQLAKHSPVYHVYETKLALMLIDSDNAQDKQRGIATLEKLANNTCNLNRDMAQYYAGLYYWSANDEAKARTAWHDLLPLAQAEVASPWARLAADKIAQLPA